MHRPEIPLCDFLQPLAEIFPHQRVAIDFGMLPFHFVVDPEMSPCLARLLRAAVILGIHFAKGDLGCAILWVIDAPSQRYGPITARRKSRRVRSLPHLAPRMRRAPV